MAFTKKTLKHSIAGIGGGIVLALLVWPLEIRYSEEPWVWVFFIPSIVAIMYGIYARWFIE